jgi:hypothetical protein
VLGSKGKTMVKGWIFVLVSLWEIDGDFPEGIFYITSSWYHIFWPYVVGIFPEIYPS